MSYATLPPFPRPVRKVGASLAVIIVLGTIAGLILTLLTAVNPAGTALGFILSTIAMSLVLMAYLWLDRWEPEPPRLLVLAFLWGASVAIVVSVILELLVESAVNAGQDETSFFTVAVAAPVIEEAAKGAFLLLMMTGVRRHELNSLTDCLVYAGVTAVGFAWLEDIFYIANGESLASSLVTAAMRLIMAPFAHPLFTTFTGIGVYFALQQRHTAAKVGYITLGFAGAVIMLVIGTAGIFSLATLAIVGINFYPVISITGKIGDTYRVDYSTALEPTTWIPLSTNVLTSSPQLILDATSPGDNTRFYRAVLLQ